MNGNNLHTTGGSKVQYIFLPNDSHWASLPERQEAVKQTMTDIFALAKVQAGGGGVVFFYVPTSGLKHASMILSVRLRNG